MALQCHVRLTLLPRKLLRNGQFLNPGTRCHRSGIRPSGAAFAALIHLL